MINHLKILKIIIIVLYASILMACASKPVAFDIATEHLAKDLLEQIQGQHLFAGSDEAKKIVLDDFTDEESGEVIKVSQVIEEAIFKEATAHFKHFSLSKLSSTNISHADYIISGIIAFEKMDKKEEQKYYHVFASATDKETGALVAKTSAWVLGTNLDFTPVKEYKDSPVYMNDNRHKSKVLMARGQTGSQVNNEYYKSMNTNATLSEASRYYGQKKYRKAFKLYSQAERKPDGKTMKTYAGLYQTNLKLGKHKAAEAAFGRLLEISVKDNNNLSVKLLFQVGSTQFISDRQMQLRYKMWLGQISRLLKTHQYCTSIIGHSSKTGNEKYNNRLSKKRAEAVKQRLAGYYRSIQRKIRTEGKGFQENIKGLGTDDSRDAIDRRVEFKIVDCSD